MRVELRGVEIEPLAVGRVQDNRGLVAFGAGVCDFLCGVGEKVTELRFECDAFCGFGACAVCGLGERVALHVVLDDFDGPFRDVARDYCEWTRLLILIVIPQPRRGK